MPSSTVPGTKAVGSSCPQCMPKALVSGPRVLCPLLAPNLGRYPQKGTPTPSLSTPSLFLSSAWTTQRCLPFPFLLCCPVPRSAARTSGLGAGHKRAGEQRLISVSCFPSLVLDSLYLLTSREAGNKCSRNSSGLHNACRAKLLAWGQVTIHSFHLYKTSRARLEGMSPVCRQSRGS